MTTLFGNFKESFSYSWNFNKDSVLRWILFLILSIIPIVNFIPIGAYAKTLKGEDPELKGVGRNFVRGLLLIILSLIYCIIPVAITWLLFLISPVLGGIVGFILGIIAALFLIPACVRYVRSGKFSQAFGFSALSEMIKGVGWGRYVLAVIILVVFFGILGLLCWIPVVGWIIGIIIFLISPVLSIFSYRYIANLFSESA